MKKLELRFEKELKGKFELKKLNLLLVFQVNCPGCFSYALPLFNALYNDLQNQDISFLALSTAFEDYDKNTTQNTRELINKGTLVGETKKMMNQNGYKKLPYELDFPIAVDKEIGKSKEELQYAVNAICMINPNYKTWPEFEQKALDDRVKNYLESLDKISFSFTLNQLRGTPSFVLFNESYEILKEWFGHVNLEEIQDKINLFSKGKMF